MKKIIECIPNFSEGQDSKVLTKIASSIESAKSVTLKCIDTGYYAHRSVFTFLGEVEPMFEAAYNSIKIATETIDMREHRGTHPRFGAIDVFPFVALEGIENEELIPLVHSFAERIAADFSIPIYLYEHSQTLPYRKNLAKIRKGEYEGLAEKIMRENWKPDFYPTMNIKSGALAMGVRDILVAFNINLDTQDVTIAKKIAEEIRYSGKMIQDENGVWHRKRGLCEGVKALGWYIKDFDRVQVSMNIVDSSKTPIHIAYETCKKIAKQYGVSVTGSELIGCIPRQNLIDAGKFYVQSDHNEIELIEIAVKKLNMMELKTFNLEKNTIEPKILL